MRRKIGGFQQTFCLKPENSRCAGQRMPSVPLKTRNVEVVNKMQNEKKNSVMKVLGIVGNVLLWAFLIFSMLITRTVLGRAC